MVKKFLFQDLVRPFLCSPSNVDNDVERWCERRSIAPKDLPNDALDAVADHSASKLASRRHTKSGMGQVVRFAEENEVRSDRP